MGKHTKRNAAIAIVLIVVIGAGIFLGLAYPFPVQTTPVSLTGILTQEDIPTVIGWPNSQMQVIIQLSTVSAIWSWEIRDASDTYLVGAVGISTSTVTTPWYEASGSYTIRITCIGTLEGTVTVVARGFPFITT